MMDANWTLREALGEQAWTTVIVVPILAVLFAAILMLVSYEDRENLKKFKQEAIERGFASYKIDSKGVVTFEWNESRKP